MSPAIRIVLVDTSHPGNIGASARAMKNMGLESLVLVRPQARADAEATARASGAADLLARARLVDSVPEAIGDCGLVLGTTARARSANWRVLDAREAAAELVAASATRPAAVLFGGERNGLANEELERCQALVRIPSDAQYESLNLAQAVQVVCYEIRMAVAGLQSRAGEAEPPATADEMSALNAHLERVMRETGFMHEGNAEQLGARVRRLVARAQPDDGEVRILRGWLAAIERRLRAAE
ncbi:MAG TPA: RNA methyltransferase [Steroidobacteraceae bacterium]|jgi:tRNA (cytidine32/uridine32-2'-O)-methyltransferase|nr:RNA methyltransferase [Steroidobacteraceae bacterium]